MSKRIFPAPAAEAKSTPNCYYHKLPITHFCTKKKCTLPLCDECLPIHKKQHIKEKEIAMEGIVEFQAARTSCLTAFTQRKAEIEAIQEKFKAKVMGYRTAIIEIVDRIVDKFFEDCLITDGYIEILKEIQQRTSQIRAGSLKELIRYYEDIYGAEHFRKLYKMYNGDYLSNFVFQLDHQKAEEVVSAGIVNVALKVSSTQNKKNSQSGSLEVSEYRERNPLPINIYLNSSQIPNPAKHISTEQESQSDISSYKLIKSKKDCNLPTNHRQSNIYTQPNSKIHQRLSHIPSSNTSHVSKSRSTKKKGISLVKSQKQLPIHSQQNFTIEDQKSANTDRRSNWRNFINMGHKRPEEQQQRQQTLSNNKNELNLVLNPTQMRELLAKKKSEQKYKAKVARRQPETIEQIPQRS